MSERVDVAACPYCHDDDGGDGYGYPYNRMVGEETCEKCGKRFIVGVHATYKYESMKIEDVPDKKMEMWGFKR